MGAASSTSKRPVSLPSLVCFLRHSYPAGLRLHRSRRPRATPRVTLGMIADLLDVVDRDLGLGPLGPRSEPMYLLPVLAMAQADPDIDPSSVAAIRPLYRDRRKGGMEIAAEGLL